MAAATLALPGTITGATPEDAPAPFADRGDTRLTGREIFEKVIANRFDSYIQESTLVSGDRSGNVQKTQLSMLYQSYLDENDEPVDGVVISKSLVRYTHPFEMRHTGYLVVNNRSRPNDQFVYRSSSGRIRRVNLRGESVFGSDFSLEDVIPRELEDSTYERLDDATEQEREVWVVIVTPKPEIESEYSKVQVYVEQDRAVPLRSRYWDDRGIEFKELTVAAEKIELREKIWIPMQMRMRNTRLESFTDLIVRDITPNAPTTRTDFDLRRLLAH